ncbi:MAG: hypothetical protein L6365_05745, partial [Desulfobulbaceae bacterium]|nr:hypothetical protein [Desulfobulbaceae bacterium]
SDLVAPIEQNRRRSSAPARILRLRHGQRWPEDGMRYGILAFSESLITDFLILGPERYEAPFEHGKLAVRCAGNKPHRSNVLRWRDIISWFKAGRFLEVEMAGQFFWCWQGKAATHDASQSQVEWKKSGIRIVKE